MMDILFFKYLYDIYSNSYDLYDSYDSYFPDCFLFHSLLLTSTHNQGMIISRAIMAKTLSDFFEREYSRLQQIGTILDGDSSTILTRRRSIKRTAYDPLTSSSQVRQYALRRSSSSSIEAAPKKPVLDLPSDVTEAQYCLLEQIMGQLQQGIRQMTGKSK